MTEVFKTLEDLFEVAVQNTLWVKLDSNIETNSLELKDWYDRVADIVLDPKVPESVRMKFDAAKNILLYSWFSYEIMPAAELYSYSILEEALRIRLRQENNKKIGLNSLLLMAIEDGILNDSGFDTTQNRGVNIIRDENGQLQIENPTFTIEEQEKCTEYTETLCQLIPKVRNLYAHGHTSLHPFARLTLMRHAEMINMLFE